MQITSTRITVRWRILALVACVLTAFAPSLMAQLRFAGPSNQPDYAPKPPAFRTNEPVRQAQFQPVEPALTDDAPPPPPSIAPQLPSASDELKAGPGVTMSGAGASQPPIGATGATVAEPVPAGPIVQETHAGMPTLPLETTWDNSWSDSFAPELVQQEQAILYTTNAWFRRGFWYSQADVVALLRTEGAEVRISGDNSGAGTNVVSDLNAPVLTSKTVDPTYAPGTRITLGRFLGQDVVNRDHTVEFTFLGLFDYSETASLVALTPNGIVDALGQGNHYFTTGITGLIVGVSTPGYGDALRHDIQYDSDMNSFEANFRILHRPLRDRLDLQPNGSWVRNASASKLTSFLVGMRVLSINEMFRLQATFQDPSTSGLYTVKTSNDMFGLQLGGDVVENYARWSWGARFKAGGLFNFADRRSDSNVQLGGFQQDPRTELVDGENLAAVVEAGLVATYQVRTNLMARVAYDAMYITGFANAPENLGLGQAFPTFEVTGDAVFHGLSVGFEMLW